MHEGTSETTRHEGLLITTPRQTLHDLRHHPRIASMTSEALFLRLIDEPRGAGATRPPAPSSSAGCSA